MRTCFDGIRPREMEMDFHYLPSLSSMWLQIHGKCLFGCNLLAYKMNSGNKSFPGKSNNHFTPFYKLSSLVFIARIQCIVCFDIGY